MNQDKEDELFLKRIRELAGLAYSRGIPVYTSFLNLNEISLFYKIIKDIPNISYKLWGGYEEAERRVICFYEDDSFADLSFPVTCLSIKPLHAKYSDTLTHRDYLGAVLNLSIERSKIGDILVFEKEARLFCNRDLAPFILDNLKKIKRTDVALCEIIFDKTEWIQKTELIQKTVASVRLDAVVSASLNESRSSLAGFISGGRVFVNGKMITSNSFIPKEEDLISVRGYGRFKFKRVEEQTKKNRYRILIEKYL